MEGLNQFFQSRAAEMWIALAFLVLILEVWLVILHRRLDRLQSALRSVAAPVAPLSSDEHAAIARLQEILPTSLQKVGFVRFNPFGDTGGDQSFAMVLADAQGNGIVMSSLHRRNESKVYAKPLAQWQSTYSLSAEELQAIVMARGDQSN